MPIGLLDLSIVTDRLIKQLTDCAAATRLWAEDEIDPPPAPRFNITFSGLPPDALNDPEHCQVSLYLFHVTPDKFYRNTFPLNGRLDPSRDPSLARPRQIPAQPLALTLYYLLSAHSKKSYVQEQQAMSIALKCFHDHPIVTATVPIDDRIEEFTLTMETQSVDEIGRLWQATTSPMRLSVVYKAGVVFLEPEEPAREPAKAVIRPEVRAYPQMVVSRAIADVAGRVTVWGDDFVARSLVVEVDGVEYAVTANNPPNAGEFHVVDETKLDLQLPPGTQRGPHRLSVQLTADQSAGLFTLNVPANVP